MLLNMVTLAGRESLELVSVDFFRAPKILLAALILAATSALSVVVESMVEPMVQDK